MHRQSVFLVSLTTAFATACAPSAPDAVAEDTVTGAPELRLGAEVLLTDSLHLVAGRRVGLITNHTGVYWQDPVSGSGDPTLGSVIDALNDAPQVDLVALYGPEHGIRGEAEAGAHVEGGTDAETGIPIHSLYGETLRPTPEMLDGIDVLVFDMQDVGARYYTYPSTMAYAMEAAGSLGIPFVVLDRPNPIRGDVVQGNVLDPEYSTFVGLHPTPMRHGLTMGELARMMVGEFDVDVELHVVPMQGWTRSMTHDETGMPWIPPSPNIPTLESALAYTGTCLFEGTPISVGRGTDHAFEWIGAPWLDGPALAQALEGYGIEGVRFEPATFTPTAPGDGKFDGEELHGVRLVPEASDFDAPRAAVAMLIEARRMSGDRWSWNVAHFDRLSGTDALRLGLDREQGLEALVAGWSDATAAFEQLRAPYLIY